MKRLKEQKTKIFIGDFNDKDARKIMCAAYRHNMTAANGYVWFLPRWLKKDWYNVTQDDDDSKPKLNCTTEEMVTVSF